MIRYSVFVSCLSRLYNIAKAGEIEMPQGSKTQAIQMCGIFEKSDNGSITS